MKIVNVVQKSVCFSGLFSISVTHSVSMSYGAGDGARTRDVQLGKVGVN